LRGPAFGVILGSLAAGCLLGTSVAKGLSIDQVFKVSETASQTLIARFLSRHYEHS
jgi:hypothetical protein